MGLMTDLTIREKRVLARVLEGRVKFNAAYGEKEILSADVDIATDVTAEVRSLVAKGLVKCDRRKMTRGFSGGRGPVEAR
jgi:hypothetical protein